MPKKDKLVAGRKIPGPKRRAPSSLKATSAKAGRMDPSQKKFPVAGIRTLSGETGSLHATEEQYHLLQGILQSTSDGILAVNRDSEVIFANQRFAEMWMIPEKIMTSKDDTLLLQYVLDQLSDPRGFIQRVQELYNSAEDSFDMLYFKDERVFERRSRPIMQETKVKGRVWSFHEITEHKRIEEALMASEMELRALFASMQDVVMVIDREGVYRKIAPTNPSLLVRPPEELLGKNLKEIFIAERAEASRQLIQQVLDTQQNTQIEYELMINGRSMWFQATISPLDADNSLWVAHDISNRKQMEEALRSAEARYRSIFESATVGIYQSTPDGHFLSVNPAIAHMFGYTSPEEMLASINDIGTQIYRDPTRRQEFRRAMTEQGFIKEFINEEHCKDGSWIWTSNTARVVKDDTGNILYYEGFQTDITDRKRAEEVAAEERTLLFTLINNLPDRIYVKDIEGRKIISNTADWQASGGKRFEDVLGKTDFETYPAELAARFWADDKMVLDSGQPIVNREEPGLDSQGNRIWTLTTKVPLRDKGDQIVGLVGIGHDTSNRKQAEEKLRKAEEKYRNIFENAIEGIFQSLPSGDFITANPALARMLGYGSAEELIADVNDLDHKFYEQPGRREQFMRQLNDHGMISNFESKVYCKDSRTIWISENAIAVRDDTGQVLHYEGTLIDVTGRKQAEEELRRAKDDLETVLLKLQQSLERETLLASTDGLTGLCNHRHFFELAEREFQAAVRYQYPLTFVMFDLDYFKQINDTLGHTAGDKLLVEVAQIAAAQVRASDLVARYGGDEFIVLLPHASAQQALVVAERIRVSVAAIPVDGLRDDQEPFTVTLSMGITEMRPKPADDNLERIIQRADDALYKAKRSGRNRVEIWAGSEPADH